jgi:hypothetical protein
MTEKKPPQTPEDVLRELHEFLLGEEPDFWSMPSEKVQDYLREAGVDPKPTIQAIRKSIAEAKGTHALKIAREKRRQQELADATTKTTDRTRMSRDDLLAQLMELMRGQGSGQPAAVFMRKYEKCSDDDLRSLIEDCEALGNDDDEE